MGTDCRVCWVTYPNSLFAQLDSDRPKGNGYTPKEKVRLDLKVRRKFLVYLTSGWEAMEQIAQRSCGCPMSKARSHGALHSLISWVATLTMTRGLELDGLEGPYQSKLFNDSITRVVPFQSGFPASCLLEHSLIASSSTTGMLEISKYFIRTVSLIKQILFAIAMAGLLQAGEPTENSYIFYSLLPDASLFLPQFLIG